MRQQVDRERLAWLSQLPRGSGHQVALALVVVGRPMAAEELAMASGLKSRTLTEVLRWMAALGMVEQRGDGWTLSAASLALVGKASDTVSDGNSSGPGTASRSDGKATARAARNKNAVRAAHDTPPPPKRDLTISLGSLEEEEGRRTGQRGKVEGLLASAGVGKRSAKMQQLLALDLDPDYVGRWVRYRQQRLAEGKTMPVGWLIQALQDGDAVPDCECGQCPECMQRQFGQYADVVCR